MSEAQESYRELLRDKRKLARVGKGSRINRRFMSLPMSEFARHNYSDVQAGIGLDQRTHPTAYYDPETKTYTIRQSFRILDQDDPLAQPLSRKSKYFRPIKL